MGQGNECPCTATPQSVLPITLSTFSASPKASQVEITWTTASELHNDYMAVERSGDGEQFAEIGQVKGLGTTDGPKTYAFMDDAPLQGVNYYRLRQVDFDGTTEYHKVVSVIFDGQSAQALRLFPNPAGNQLQVRWNGDAAQPSFLRILDLNGRLLQQQEMPAGILHRELPLGHLGQGVYILQISQGKTVETQRFVKE